jgi:hypothetical protein
MTSSTANTSIVTRLRPTSLGTAAAALVPALAAGLTAAIIVPLGTLGNWVVLLAGFVLTFVYLGRQGSWRESLGTGLYLLALCILVAPLWLFLGPTMSGETDALVGVVRFGIFGAAAVLIAVVCAGLGYLVQR